MKQLANELVGFWTALRRHSQVIIAQLRLEEESRIRAPIASALDMMEPLLFIGAISLLHLLVARNYAPVGTSPVLFFSTGLMPKFFFIFISQRMRKTVRRRYPAEQWLDDIAVHIVVTTTDFIVVGVVLFGLYAMFITPQAIPYDLVRIILAVSYLIMLGFGWGVIINVLTKLYGIPFSIFNGLNRLLVILSGAIFVVDFLPPVARYWLSFNPVVHALIVFRQGFYPRYPSLTLDMSYLTYCSIFAVVVGLTLERATRRIRDR